MIYLVKKVTNDDGFDYSVTEIVKAFSKKEVAKNYIDSEMENHKIKSNATIKELEKIELEHSNCKLEECEVCYAIFEMVREIEDVSYSYEIVEIEFDNSDGYEIDCCQNEKNLFKNHNVNYKGEREYGLSCKVCGRFIETFKED